MMAVRTTPFSSGRAYYKHCFLPCFWHIRSPYSAGHYPSIPSRRPLGPQNIDRRGGPASSHLYARNRLALRIRERIWFPWCRTLDCNRNDLSFHHCILQHLGRRVSGLYFGDSVPEDKSRSCQSITFRELGEFNRFRRIVTISRMLTSILFPDRELDCRFHNTHISSPVVIRRLFSLRWFIAAHGCHMRVLHA